MQSDTNQNPNNLQNPSVHLGILKTGLNILSPTVAPRFLLLNISGQKFQLRRELALKYPASRLGKIALGKRTQLSKENERSNLYDARIGGGDSFFFERDPSVFPTILVFYLTGVLHVPRNVCIESFQNEIDYWAIPFFLENCCQGYHQQEWETVETIKKTNELFKGRDCKKTSIESLGSEINLMQESSWKTTKRKVWDLFEKPSSSKAAYILSLISSLMVIISTITLCINTLPEVQITLPNGEKDDNPNLIIVEIICICWFTLEYLARAISSPSKYKFLKSVMNAIDLLAILPFYIGIIVEYSNGDLNENFTSVRRFVQILRIFRIIRIFKVARHSTGLQVLGYTVKNSRSELGLLLMLLMMGMTLFSCLVYYAEQSNPNSKFKSIIAAFWWAIITMTTVGYGDMIPETFLGKLIGGVCCVSGIIFIALPIPTIVSNFSAFYKDHINKEKLKQIYSLTDGNIGLEDSTTSVLIGTNHSSVFNVNKIVPQLERHDHYRRRMSSIHGTPC